MFVSEILKFFGHEKCYQIITIFKKHFDVTIFTPKNWHLKFETIEFSRILTPKKCYQKYQNYHIFNFKNSTKDKENVIKNPSLSYFQDIRRKYWKKKKIFTQNPNCKVLQFYCLTLYGSTVKCPGPKARLLPKWKLIGSFLCWGGPVLQGAFWAWPLSQEGKVWWSLSCKRPKVGQGLVGQICCCTRCAAAARSSSAASDDGKAVKRCPPGISWQWPSGKTDFTLTWRKSLRIIRTLKC